MWIVSTSRTIRLVEDAHGFDYYILDTPDIDLNSRLGIAFKRLLLTKLATEDYYPDNNERHEYIKAKYAKYKIPLEEVEWIGIDLNEACRKQQDIDDNTKKTPLKYIFEQELVENLAKENETLVNESEEEEGTTATFVNKELGSLFNKLSLKQKESRV